MSGLAPSALEGIAAEVAELAVGRIRKELGRARMLRTKSSATDAVTRTDLEVEELIRAELTARVPGSGVLGEEQGEVVGSSETAWIVDPLDGTVNFLYDLPVVAVSIAATLCGEVVAGAVVDVLREETFRASRGAGARRNGSRIQVNAPLSLSQALLITGFSYDAALRPRQAALIARVVGHVRDIRCFGSAALHLCWVACGRADGYWEADTKRWDVAAGAIIAEEAGALVRTPWTTGGALTLASAPSVHDALYALVGPSQGGALE